MSLFRKSNAEQSLESRHCCEGRGTGSYLPTGCRGLAQMSGFHIKDRKHWSQSPLPLKGLKQKQQKRKMARLLLLFLPGLVAICAVHGIFMDRLGSKKLCADDECVCKDFFMPFITFLLYNWKKKSTNSVESNCIWKWIFSNVHAISVISPGLCLLCLSMKNSLG